jgi:hypothetical protein
VSVVRCTDGRNETKASDKQSMQGNRHFAFVRKAFSFKGKW